MPRPLFDHFRFIAPVYDHLLGGDGERPGTADLVRAADLLALPADGWLLDAGGGTGRVSGLLREEVRGVVVLDASHGMLRQVRHKAGLAPALGEVERLPFPDGTFARILIVDAFHHFYDHPAAAADLWRVLAPGGRLVLLEPNIARWPVKLIAWGEALLLMRSRFFRAEALAALFAAQPGARVTVDVETDPTYIRLLAERE